MYTVSIQYQKSGFEPNVDTMSMPDKNVAHKLARDIAAHGFLMGGEEVSYYVLPREILSIVLYKDIDK